MLPYTQPPNDNDNDNVQHAPKETRDALATTEPPDPTLHQTACTTKTVPNIVRISAILPANKHDAGAADSADNAPSK